MQVSDKLNDFVNFVTVIFLTVWKASGKLNDFEVGFVRAVFLKYYLQKLLNMNSAFKPEGIAELIMDLFDGNLYGSVGSTPQQASKHKGSAGTTISQARARCSWTYLTASMEEALGPGFEQKDCLRSPSCLLG